jgi:hypothetical protein
MTRLRDIYGPGHSQADYQHALAAGYETGWWDEHGVPAPWPEDFLDPNSGWRPGTGLPVTTLEPGQPPF